MTGPRPPSRPPSQPVARFVAIGIANTVIDVGLFALLHEPLGIVPANVVSTASGMTFSFVANGRLAFGGPLTLRTALLFAATNVVSLWVLQPIVILTGVDLLGLDAVVAKLAAVGASTVTNYVSYRYLVWPDRRQPERRRPPVRDQA
ncbi:MAG TPA: GtrA family protein [Nocardioides sp.]|nr:GtrA family protein [Nocardioides sp.]